MRRGPETYELEADYNGFVLCTDGKKFFAKGEGREVLHEAASLDALKAKCRKPKELSIDAVILETERYWYNEDEEPPAPMRVRVYGVSPTGAILYEDSKGKKDKTTRHGVDVRALRQPDGSEITRYIELKKAARAAKKVLDTFVKAWPVMRAQDYLTPEGAGDAKSNDAVE